MSNNSCGKCGAPRVDSTDRFCPKCGAPYAPAQPEIVEPTATEPNDDLDGQEWVHDVYTKYMETPAEPPEAVEPSPVQPTVAAPEEPPPRSFSALNPSHSERACTGVFLGLLFNFFYGLIPGFFILFVLMGLSSGFLPGASRMGSSSFGPMILMVISLFVGLFIFPFAGASWFSKNRKWTKGRLAFITVLIHTLFAYGLLVMAMSGDRMFPEANAQQVAPDELSTSASIPVSAPTLPPTPTLEGRNHFEQGEQYLWRHENYVQAVESFTKYINLNPADPAGYEKRGNSYQELKRYSEALNDYDRAIDLKTESSDVYGKRGHVHRHLGQYRKAIRDYDQWLELDPETLWPHHYKGMAYRELEQYDVAIQNWEAYVELRLIRSANWSASEQAANAYTNIGLAYVELGQYQKAIDHFDKALAIDQAYSGAIRGKERATNP